MGVYKRCKDRQYSTGARYIQEYIMYIKVFARCSEFCPSRRCGNYPYTQPHFALYEFFLYSFYKFSDQQPYTAVVGFFIIILSPIYFFTVLLMMLKFNYAHSFSSWEHNLYGLFVVCMVQLYITSAKGEINGKRKLYQNIYFMRKYEI